MVNNLLIFCMLFISLNLSAQEGVITVLEAPVFATPNIKSKVIQYHRKGQKVYVHPAEYSKDEFKDLFESNPKQVKEDKERYETLFKDKLFDKGKTYYPTTDSKFVKTLTRSAREGYILKEHIFLLYHDKRELDQKVIEKDTTDYRIDEPLPKNYPILTPTGYRGQAFISLGTPTTQAYPYAESINDSGYDFSKEFTFVWSRQVKFDVTRRFFFGSMFTYHHSFTTYLTDNLESEETESRIGIGPFLSYDVWKIDNYIVNLYSSLILNVLNTKTIKQTFLATNQTEIKDYKSMYFSPKFGASFMIKNILSNFDLVTGVNITLNLPHTYEASDSAGTASYWQDSFSVGYFAEQSYFLGLQSDY